MSATRTKPVECTHCGAPVQTRGKRVPSLCRICATRASYVFLYDALVNRYRAKPLVAAA